MKKYTLSRNDLISAGKGLGIALVGAGLTYLANWVNLVDFGTYTPLITAVAGVLFNVAWKVLDGKQA